MTYPPPPDFQLLDTVSLRSMTATIAACSTFSAAASLWVFTELIVSKLVRPDQHQLLVAPARPDTIRRRRSMGA